jgi:hypothetical protein
MKIVPVKQGGVLNYLGKQKIVSAPIKWRSAPDHPLSHLVYITDDEIKLLIKKDLHNSMPDGKANLGPAGLRSLNGGGGGSEGAGSDSGGGGSDASSPGDTGGAGGNDGMGGHDAGGSSGTGGSDVGSNEDSGYGGDTTSTAEDAAAAGNGGYDPDAGWDGTQSLNDQGFNNNNLGGQNGMGYDYEAAAYGIGAITSDTYNVNSFGPNTVTIEQTPGTISSRNYVNTMVNSMMRSPDLTPQQKANELSRMQSMINSPTFQDNLAKDDPAAALYGISLIDNAYQNVMNNPNYANITNQVDRNGVTFGQNFIDNPLSSLAKYGLTGLLVKGGYESYKNNVALTQLGFTPSSTTSDGAGDTSGGGDSYNNAIQTILQKVNKGYTGPSAAKNFTQQYPSSTQSGTLSFQSAYNTAKQNLGSLLTAPMSPYGNNAVSASPFYDYLKKNNLDRGIL